MNELYELAKQIDVIIIFYIFMGAGIYGIVSTIMNGIWLVKDSIKKRKAKKKSAEGLRSADRSDRGRKGYERRYCQG